MQYIKRCINKEHHFYYVNTKTNKIKTKRQWRASKQKHSYYKYKKIYNKLKKGEYRGKDLFVTRKARKHIDKYKRVFADAYIEKRMRRELMNSLRNKYYKPFQIMVTDVEEKKNYFIRLSYEKKPKEGEPVKKEHILLNSLTSINYKIRHQFIKGKVKIGIKKWNV